MRSFGVNERIRIETGPDLISRLEALGCRVSLDGDKLNLSAPKGVLTDELREEIRQRRSEVIQYLQASEATRHGNEAPRDAGPVRHLHADGQNTFPVSFAQERLYFLHRLQPRAPHTASLLFFVYPG